MMRIEVIAVGCEEMIRSNARHLLTSGISSLAMLLGMAGQPGEGSLLVTNRGGGERDLEYSWQGVDKALRRFSSGSYEEVHIVVRGRDMSGMPVSISATVVAKEDWNEKYEQVVVGSIEFTATFESRDDSSIYELGVDILEETASRVCADFGRVSTQLLPVGRKELHGLSPVPLTGETFADRVIPDASWALLLGTKHLARLGGIKAVERDRTSKQLENGAGISMLLVRATADACAYDSEQQRAWAESLRPVLA